MPERFKNILFFPFIILLMLSCANNSSSVVTAPDSADAAHTGRTHTDEPGIEAAPQSDQVIDTVPQPEPVSVSVIQPEPVTEAVLQPGPVTESAPQPGPAMVSYDGPLLNIFFHILVAKPVIGVRGRRREHYLTWFVTAGEYKKILYELYINNYVLVDINELYEVDNSTVPRRVRYKKPLIPAGKKPLVLSIDDLNYYRLDRESGSVHKLVIDENGGIAAWTDNRSGGELSYDLDVVTYLEEFVKMYPDFSVRGAKGIIAPTGFEGVLGYRTHELNAPHYEEEKAKAVVVVEKLKELGWRFASHSWGHPDLSSISMNAFINDTNRWDNEVRPIVGDTDLFIYPLGAGVEHQEARHRILRERNFNIFLA